jgi:hypothetical protein
VIPLLQTNEWLIRPEALRSIALCLRAFRERGGPLQEPAAQSPLVSVGNGIATVSIEGPIIRKPDILARVLLGATSHDEIGAALGEAGARPDVKAVILDIDSPEGTVASTPELAATVASLNGRKPFHTFFSTDGVRQQLQDRPELGTSAFQIPGSRYHAAMIRRITGDYLTVSTAGEAFKAFVPRPLPPDPPVAFGGMLERLHAEALLALGRLDGVASLLSEPKQFLYAYVRKEAAPGGAPHRRLGGMARLLLPRCARHRQPHHLGHPPGAEDFRERPRAHRGSRAFGAFGADHPRLFAAKSVGFDHRPCLRHRTHPHDRRYDPWQAPSFGDRAGNHRRKIRPAFRI